MAARKLWQRWAMRPWLPSWFRLSTLACAACLLAVPACDDGSDDEDDDAADGADGADTGSAGGALECLQGAWVCTLPDMSTAEMTIDGMMIDGSFAMGPAMATVEAMFMLDGETISVVDTGGTGACPADQTGTYTLTCEADALIFDQVSDDCMGRSNFFGCEWTRP